MSNEASRVSAVASETRRARARLLACLIPITVVLVVAPEGAAQSAAATWEGVLAEFSAQMADDVRADGVGGLTAGVVVGTDLVWAQGFGWADVERSIPAGVNTIYRTGSISKSFTAVYRPALWSSAAICLPKMAATVYIAP